MTLWHKLLTRLTANQKTVRHYFFPMGWSFRESIKILPGIRLNFSRRGVGASIGTRGLHLGFGGGRAPRITGGIGPLHYYQSLGSNRGDHPRAVPTRRRRAHFGLLTLLVAGIATWFGWKVLPPQWKSTLLAPVAPLFPTPAVPPTSTAHRTTVLPTAASNRLPASTSLGERHLPKPEAAKHKGPPRPESSRARIGLPKIGAGLAGGDWPRIECIVDEELADCDVTVVEYQP